MKLFTSSETESSGEGQVILEQWKILSYHLSLLECPVQQQTRHLLVPQVYHPEH